MQSEQLMMGWGSRFTFWDAPKQEFLLRFDIAWNRTVEDRFQANCKDFTPPIGQDALSIDLGATRKLSTRLLARERGLCFFLQIGAQPTNLSRSKWKDGQSPYCDCGMLDTLEHKWFDCTLQHRSDVGTGAGG